MFTGIDLSSDTATRPTSNMLNAMIKAEVGDEQKGEDPTTNELEAFICEKMGFSAAVFLPSATMANQIAIMLHCNPGDEIIAAANSHIFQSESGGPAIHANVMCHPIFTPSGIFSSADIRKNLRFPKTIRQPVLKLISVENTCNFAGGTIWDKKKLNDIILYANEFQLKTHMDGARIFNASVKLAIEAKKLVSGFDTLTICLSKGLGCPVGALLLFDKIHKEKIYRLKHLMGGALRQSGILAAAGLYALNHHIERLAEDHLNATILAEKLSAIKEINVINSSPETNIVIFEWLSKNISPAEFHQTCIKKNVRFSQIGQNKFRAVTHLGISKDDIDKTVNILKNF